MSIISGIKNFPWTRRNVKQDTGLLKKNKKTCYIFYLWCIISHTTLSCHFLVKHTFARWVILIECKLVIKNEIIITAYLLLTVFFAMFAKMCGECLCVHIQWSDRRRLQCGRAELTSPACARALFSSLCSIRHTHKDKHTNTRRFPSHPAACLSAKWVLTARLHPRPHNNLAYTHIHSPLSCPSCYTHKHTYPGGLCVFVFLWLQGKWEPVRSDCDAYEYLWVFACSLWHVCEDTLWPFRWCMCVSAVVTVCGELLWKVQ